jgi:hypothetical protein
VRHLRRYRELRQRFDSPAHDVLYADWLTSRGVRPRHTLVAHGRLDRQSAY